MSMIEDKDLYFDISLKYIIELIPKIESVLWAMFDTSKYQKVESYILRWHIVGQDWNNPWENFEVVRQANEKIDLLKTLSRMPSDILIKIAIDLEIDTPGFLPAIPTFKNVLKYKNENALKSFARALKNVFENPDEAITLANTTLEGIIKTILADELFADIQFNKKATLFELAEEVLKRFNAYPSANSKIPEIRNIGSSLLKASQNIEILRSSKTNAHGKSQNDFLIDDPLWAHFIVNSVTTIGLFLVEFFEKRYKPNRLPEQIPVPAINLDDIPF